jgi:tRNA threonylcarbamoyladenosine biosynthesis protein TsaE
MPILNPNAFEFFSRSPEQTRRLGIRLGVLLHAGDTLCLSGELGAGKTTFVQGVAQGWGSLDAATSPTFVLVNEYVRPNGFRLHHLDAYRLKNTLEAEDLDIGLMLERGALVVEWPERIRSALPEQNLWIDMRWIDEMQRGMVFSPHGKRALGLLNEFRKGVVRG